MSSQTTEKTPPTSEGAFDFLTEQDRAMWTLETSLRLYSLPFQLVVEDRLAGSMDAESGTIRLTRQQVYGYFPDARSDPEIKEEDYR